MWEQLNKSCGLLEVPRLRLWNTFGKRFKKTRGSGWIWSTTNGVESDAMKQLASLVWLLLLHLKKNKRITCININWSILKKYTWEDIFYIFSNNPQRKTPWFISPKTHRTPFPNRIFSHINTWRYDEKFHTLRNLRKMRSKLFCSFIQIRLGARQSPYRVRRPCGPMSVSKWVFSSVFYPFRERIYRKTKIENWYLPEILPRDSPYGQ